MKKVALALGSGGSRGFAHIGVLKAFEEEGIDVCCIAGSSMGAIIGALYASGLSASEIEKLAKSFDFVEALKLLDIGAKKAILKGNKLSKYFAKILPVLNFEDLKIPLYVVATDVKTGNEFIFSKGALLDALRASSSIPFVFQPFSYNGRELMDGAVSNPIPVSVLKKNYKDTKVVAVNLDAFLVEDKKKRKINFEMRSIKTLNILRYNLAKHVIKDADFVINPKVGNFYWFEFSNTDRIIKAGYEAAKELDFDKLRA